MAASMSARAKPMLSMLAMAASRSLPMVNAEGSSKRLSADCCAGAGEGVPGTFWEAAERAGADGAAGAAGVCAGGGAGVEGGLLDDAAWVFGCDALAGDCTMASVTYPRDHANDEALFLNVVRLNSLIVLEDLA